MRPRAGHKHVNVGARIDPGLATNFRAFANSQGITTQEALRRLMIQAIIDRKIPGVDPLEMEHKTVPVYDGEEERPASKQQGERLTPAPPAQ